MEGVFGGWFGARRFWRRPAVQIVLGAALAINLATWFGLAFFLPKSPFPFTLHYTAHLGADFFGRRADLFTIPAGGLFIVGVNALLAAWLWDRERVLASIMLAATALLQVGLAVGSVFLVLANV